MYLVCPLPFNEGSQGTRVKKAIPILYTVINDVGYGKALFWEVGEDLSYPFFFTSHA